MSPRTGRPTTDKKSIMFRVRLSEKDIDSITACAEKLKVTKSEVVRMAIEMLSEKLK